MNVLNNNNREKYYYYHNIYVNGSFFRFVKDYVKLTKVKKLY